MKKWQNWFLLFFLADIALCGIFQENLLEYPVQIPAILFGEWLSAKYIAWMFKQA